MCSIAGFSHFSEDYLRRAPEKEAILKAMNHRLKHRGPDEDGILLTSHCGLAHTRLSILDPEMGKQPMSANLKGHQASICFNGEIYNMPALKERLRTEGIRFESNCDTEVLLYGYLLHGIEFVKECNGIFAFSIWDEILQKLYLVRDRLGVKPLFYTIINDTLVFSSEPKGLFCYPGIKPVADLTSLREIFGLGPAKSYGKGVFQGVSEVLPGHYLEFDDCLTDHCYWQLESRPHTDSYEETLEKTRFLVTDAIKMQMLSDVPICSFLSGGIDSSIVAAVCSNALRDRGMQLSTYSFDFVGNEKFFTANAFQPSEDRPFVDRMTAFLGTRHTYLECDNSGLLTNLYKAVDARDLPCMADVEGSMLFFCEQVAKHHKVALTGECADEIFGGYPWFHKKECFESDLFPWSMDFTPRCAFLKDEVLKLLNLEDYARSVCAASTAETPYLMTGTSEEKRRREISYLNLRWFMQTLLDRMDRTSMYAGLEARVPFADHRIVEYLFNVPWEMKCRNGVEKSLLRDAFSHVLPKEILHRKKSPYPKTYDPAYEKLIRMSLLEVLRDPSAPIQALIDPEKTLRFLDTPSDYGKPFYGQLMAGPQLLAYLLQVNYWLKSLNVEIRL